MSETQSEVARSGATQAGAPMHKRPQVKHPYLVLMALLIGAFTGMYSETAINIILPQIGGQFHVATATSQWLVIGYMLMIGFVLPFSSILTKHFTIKSLAIFALSAFTIGAVISAAAPTFAILLIGRAIQGIGLGIVLPLAFSMVMEVMPPQKLGAAMGMVSLIIMLAPVVGPTLAGILTGIASWRLVFVSIAVLGVIGLVFAFMFLISPMELTKPKVDTLSVVLSVIGFGGVVLGAGMASEFRWISAPVLSALIIGIAALIWYSMRQLKQEIPVLNLRAFTFRDFAIGTTLVMLNFGITLSVMFLIPQFFQYSLALGVSLAGALMLPGGIVNALTSMLSGRAYDKIGAKKPAILGFFITIIGIVMILGAIFANALNPALIVTAHIIMMIGVPLAMSPMQTYALGALPRKYNADGSTIMNTLQQVVGAVFTAVTTSLLTAGVAAVHGSKAAQFSNGTKYGLYFALIMAILGFVGAFFISDKKKAETHEEAAETPAAVDSTEIEPALMTLMKTDVYTVSEDTTAMEAMRLFTSHGISGVPVVAADGKLKGFVSDGDVLNLLADQNPEFTSFYSAVIESNSDSFSKRVRNNLDTPVSEIATKNVISVDVTDSMSHICEVLVAKHLKKVPVVDSAHGGKMVGILNRSDVLKFVVEQY
ncbi:MFS transporter [Alloscardovia venturai]|uniref:MFS transporter n=1 Tax=Alloscardovia venturai TaxID=1769421 RepID=A0ABW2Y1Y1_9BIFI